MALTYVHQESRRRGQLNREPNIDETAVVQRSRLGEWTAVGARSRIMESTMDDYSYCVDEAIIHYAAIGKFCNIASHVCKNPGNHPMWRVTLHHANVPQGRLRLRRDGRRGVLRLAARASGYHRPRRMDRT
ncbi:hypothetical protein SAMN02799624_02432 [Paenibacillus sp. UNC496MF]|uniref:hypothetical protein n=1 Tax=Paenibacillus sp. UNC496MF TaxID=1502753 RepID=UPI0008E22851|nr:hypothetical protein [Paenibacillus sp. UNC496MF]SFI87075.1 hypothetical protein SAMN02799624_02432 [Paenibacillus sp. UNC496MF]